jgi:hypothetical protein
MWRVDRQSAWAKETNSTADAATSATKPVARTVIPPRINRWRNFLCLITERFEGIRWDALDLSESEKQAGSYASRETIRKRVTREISQNPRWREAKSTGQAFVIVGRSLQGETRTTKMKADHRSRDLAGLRGYVRNADCSRIAPGMCCLKIIFCTSALLRKRTKL